MMEPKSMLLILISISMHDLKISTEKKIILCGI